ncbi:MAG: LemA family protein [Candidatus Nealsonbacteria bacterium]
MNFFLIIVALVVILALWLILTYNRFVTLRNRVKEAWSDIDVQLKRRYDLIPNLVETVKGYASHERQLLENVTRARTQAMGAKTLKERGDAENALSQTLKSLFAVSENYPALRAAENFLELQRELTDTEDKIQASRRFYNGNVRDFNTILQTFPQNTVAGFFKFKAAEFFEIQEAVQKEPVSVKF